MLLVYDTSGSSFQVFSWSPSTRYLKRSKLASTRLCSKNIIVHTYGTHQILFATESPDKLLTIIYMVAINKVLTRRLGDK